jgi:hypothetical protein
MWPDLKYLPPCRKEGVPPHNFALLIPALLWVPSHNFAFFHSSTFMSFLTQFSFFSSRHFYKLIHTILQIFHPNTSSLAQFCSFWIQPLLSAPSHKVALFYPITFMSSLTQLSSSHPSTFMSYHTNFIFFIPSLLWVDSHNFANFSSQHKIPRTVLLFLNPTTFISSLTQCCSFLSHHFYEFPHSTLRFHPTNFISSLTQLCSFHPTTFMRSLTQFCSLIPPHLWVLSHDFALFTPALLWVPSHNFVLFSSQHIYEFPHTTLIFFHPSTFTSFLTQFCSFFIPALLWDTSHNFFQFFHPNTFLRYLTQFFPIFSSHHFYEIPHTIFSNFFHPNTFMSSSHNFLQFFHRSTFISSCLGGVQARMKNITCLVGLCNKVSGMRKLHYFASTYINCKGTPAMEFFMNLDRDMYVLCLHCRTLLKNEASCDRFFRMGSYCTLYR